MIRLRAFGVVAIVLCFSARVVCAQATPTAGDEVARNLFNAGKVAYDAGDYQDALRFFEQAYERSQRTALLYNIGQAADRLRQDQRAIEAFRAYLEQTPDASNRVEVENRIRALEQSRNAAAATTSAPTPEQTARAAELPAPVSPAHEPVTRASTDDGGGVATQWWFWTAIGVVVVGGTIAAVALASGGDEAAPLMQGDVGGTIITLESR